MKDVKLNRLAERRAKEYQKQFDNAYLRVCADTLWACAGDLRKALKRPTPKRPTPNK